MSDVYVRRTRDSEWLMWRTHTHWTIVGLEPLSEFEDEVRRNSPQLLIFLMSWDAIGVWSSEAEAAWLRQWRTIVWIFSIVVLICDNEVGSSTVLYVEFSIRTSITDLGAKRQYRCVSYVLQLRRSEGVKHESLNQPPATSHFIKLHVSPRTLTAHYI
jgi:hypothetical protein